jgi:hypothetical protein
MTSTGRLTVSGVSFVEDAVSALGGARLWDLVRSHFPAAKSVGAIDFSILFHIYTAI